MKETIDFLLENTLWGNSLFSWLASLSVVLLGLVGLLILKTIVVKRLAAVKERVLNAPNKLVVKIIRQTRFLLVLIFLIYLGAMTLVLPPQVSSWLQTLAVIVLLIQSGFWATGLVSFILERRREEQPAEQGGTTTTLNVVELVAKWVIWSLVVLLVLDNLPQVEVTTLIASLGIGGIAVGLAVQNILADLFASLSIALDKPFVIGDFINVGEFSGNVEHIGLKSTRLRSISGEQLVFSNSDLLSSRIRNYKRMLRRRIIFNFGITYETPPDKVAQIPRILEEIISAQENATFDRAHFKAFGDHSLDFEIVFYMEMPDYIHYMDAQQAINLALLERFAHEGIEFAYPTQKLFVTQEPQTEGEKPFLG
jgi:small-conductance mechanosensitive channel